MCLLTFVTCIEIVGLTPVRSHYIHSSSKAHGSTCLLFVGSLDARAGLRNAILSNIPAVDGIFQIVRALDGAEVTHARHRGHPKRAAAQGSMGRDAWSRCTQMDIFEHAGVYCGHERGVLVECRDDE